MPTLQNNSGAKGFEIRYDSIIRLRAVPSVVYIPAVGHVTMTRYTRTVYIDFKTTSESRDSVTFGRCQTSESVTVLHLSVARRQGRVTELHFAVTRL